ncbi:MAG TPA: flavin reductase family protein [Armatimonadota bacterium]
MAKRPITVTNLRLQPFTAFEPEGILLVSGADPAHANPMTISWGMFGIMWGKPVVMVMVRPTRHTWNFISTAPDFTVNWMSEDWSDATRLCGTQSGRDADKFAATGLSPVKGSVVNSPILEESALSLECRTLYRTDLRPEQFLDASILSNYPEQDYHGLFFGEIVAATGVEHFMQLV